MELKQTTRMIQIHQLWGCCVFFLQSINMHNYSNKICTWRKSHIQRLYWFRNNWGYVSIYKIFPESSWILGECASFSLFHVSYHFQRRKTGHIKASLVWEDFTYLSTFSQFLCQLIQLHIRSYESLCREQNLIFFFGGEKPGNGVLSCISSVTAHHFDWSLCWTLGRTGFILLTKQNFATVCWNAQPE